MSIYIELIPLIPFCMLNEVINKIDAPQKQYILRGTFFTFNSFNCHWFKLGDETLNIYKSLRILKKNYCGYKEPRKKKSTLFLK